MNGKLSSKFLLFGGIGSFCLCLYLFYLFYPRISPPLTLSTRLLGNIPKLEVGDVVFRKGTGMESFVIEKLSNHRYTHIGLVISTQPIIILHASADDNPKKPNRVILSSFDEFLSHAQSIAIKRYPLSEKMRETILLEAPLWLDREFILSTDSNALYCTTLLESILSPHITLNAQYEEIDFPAFQGKYLFPKAFYEDLESTLVYESRY